MSLRSGLGLTARLVLRAGWAPLAVFLFHGAVAGWVVNIYALHPGLDVPMHVLGGFVIAYFLSSCVAAVPEHLIAPTARPLAEAVVVISLTMAASVCWELAEFASDNLLGTRLQVDLDDTMWDMVFGLVGGAAFVAVRYARGTLGEPAPLAVSGNARRKAR